MSLARWVARNAAFAPDKTALRCGDLELSYALLDRRVGQLAAGLRATFGIGVGDRVAHLGLNHPDTLALLFACARLGAILVPLNWRLAPAEHRAILADADPKLLIVDAAFAPQVEADPASYPVDRRVGYDWIGGDQPLPPEEGRPDDPVLIVYTSGTTGRPKGAVLSQSALFWNAVNSAHMHDLSSDDHVLTVLPLFHVGGLNIQTLPALHAGATVTLHPRFDPGATIATIDRQRPSLTVLVPATMTAIIGHPDWQGADWSSLRMLTTGSQIVPRALIERFHDRGIPVAQVYGTTETAPIAVYQRRADATRSVGSTGKPALHSALRVIAPTGEPAQPGTEGEVLIRGPHLMSHYWRNPEATAAALRDGWFHTGDVGHVDEHGDLWIDARTDDLIKSGGERIYPAELEDLLRLAPGVSDAAVVGRADPTFGEVPVAVVVASGERPPPDRILACLEGRVARFKHPKAVVFVDELPRSALGKVLRYRLRTLVEAEDSYSDRA